LPLPLEFNVRPDHARLLVFGRGDGSVQAARSSSCDWTHSAGSTVGVTLLHGSRRAFERDTAPWFRQYAELVHDAPGWPSGDEGERRRDRILHALAAGLAGLLLLLATGWCSYKRGQAVQAKRMSQIPSAVDDDEER
jgi:hypothetical protein